MSNEKQFIWDKVSDFCGNISEVLQEKYNICFPRSRYMIKLTGFENLIKTQFFKISQKSSEYWADEIKNNYDCGKVIKI